MTRAIYLSFGEYFSSRFFFRHRVVVKLADEGLPHGGGPDQVGPGPPACDFLSERIDPTSGRPGQEQTSPLARSKRS